MTSGGKWALNDALTPPLSHEERGEAFAETLFALSPTASRRSEAGESGTDDSGKALNRPIFR